MLPLLLLGACSLITQPKPAPQYVVGEPYQADGVWRYPREDFALNDTGLATVYDRRGLTAAGEVFDASALTAAHPTLQLPALARITNLENGRQILVRINDRGPEAATRSLGLSRRAAELLDAPGTTGLRVRIQVQEPESRRMAGETRQEPAAIAVAAAPSSKIQAESLAPPTGAAQSARVQLAVARPAPQSSNAGPEPAAVPLRLTEEYWQTTPRPGQLAIECGSFSRPEYANVQRNRLAGFGARVTTDYYAPRDRAFIVRLGPFADIATAEAALRRALPMVPDARIVVE
ncbi:MAG: SPOR domain-containing protein [Alphaproteobacteria bacterium]|nr:SPOR domain-containing protein [Alphaproteobacteria bacterium]